VIADFLFENPGTGRDDIIAKFAKKWRVSVSTIDRYLAEARKAERLRVLKISKARDEVLDEEMKKGALGEIKTRVDYILELQKIAFGSLEDRDRAPVIVSAMKAIGYDFKSEILKKYI
jgi:hypothetical protein